MKAKFATIILIGLSAIVNESYGCSPPPPPPCYAPGTPTLTSPGDGATDQHARVILQWNDVSLEDYYRVYLKANDSNPNVLVATLPADTTSYETGWLEPNTMYYWKIVAVRNCGASSTSATRSFKTHVIQTYYVAPDGNNAHDGRSLATAFATIQHAIGEVNDFDIIKVNEGAYNENIDFNGKTCTLTSTDPNNWTVTANTIIKANDSNDAVIILEGVNSVIKGFTITGGSRGIYCDGGSPLISNCVIRGNKSTGYGGGMWDSNSAPAISNCFFVENEAGYGGGLYNFNSLALITNCVFSKNTAEDGRGGGVYNHSSSPGFINCTLNRNDANGINGYGGAVYNEISVPDFKNCIVWGNTAYHAKQIFSDSNDLGTNGLVSWWKFDEGIGTTAYDSAGNNNGTIYGATWTTGLIDGALSFDGADDYVNVADNPSLRFGQSSSFSIALWVKPVSTGELLCKMQTGEKYGSFCYEIQYNSVNKNFTFVIENSGNSYTTTSTPLNSAPPGSWYFVTGIYDNMSMKIYLNSQLAGTATFSGGTTSNSDHSLAIGVRAYDSTLESYFHGIIDDVRIYNRSLNQGEIYTLASVIPCSVIRYSDIEGCGGSGAWYPNFGIDYGGNIDKDPCFVNANDPNGNDGIFGTLDDGLRPKTNSPCIDAADGNMALAVDIISVGRVDFNDVNNTGTGDPNYADIGAYEVLPLPIVTATADDNGTVEPNSAVVNYGASQLFTATANPGYEVDGWSVDGNNVQTGGTTYTLANIKANHTVVVSFKTAYGSLRVTLIPSTAQWRSSADDSNTWHNSGVSINLIAYGDSVSYGIYFHSQLGYDTPPTMSGIHIYPEQQTSRNVTYPVLTRYISVSGSDSSNNGLSALSPWRTIKYAIHHVDAGGGGNLYFAQGYYTDTLYLSDFIDLNYMTTCLTTDSSVLIKASQSVFPSSHVTFSAKFHFNQ